MRESEEHSLLPVVEDVPRAPNRKPRYRSYNNIWETRQLKILWLRTYKAKPSIDVACLRVGRDVRTFYRWMEDDKAFKEAYLALKNQWAEVVTEYLDSLDVEATKAIKEAIVQTVVHEACQGLGCRLCSGTGKIEDPNPDKRLRTETAIRVLRSHGLLPDKATVEHVGPDGEALKIVHTVELVQPEEAR